MACLIVYEASRPPFSRFQVGAFVLPCKLLPKEASLVTHDLTLGSANEFLVGGSPRFPHVEEGMGPPVGLPRAPSTSAKVGGERSLSLG